MVARFPALPRGPHRQTPSAEGVHVRIFAPISARRALVAAALRSLGGLGGLPGQLALACHSSLARHTRSHKGGRLGSVDPRVKVRIKGLVAHRGEDRVCRDMRPND